MLTLNTKLPQHRGTKWAVGPAQLAAGVLVGCLLAGCSTPLRLSDFNPFPRDMRADTDNVRGPLERILQARARDAATIASLRPPEGVAEYEQAERLYQAGDYKAAEKEFKRIAKKYADTQIEEDALFMKAESQFQQERYSWAQDSYDELLKKYPSTRYLDRSTRRLFTIARTWLNFPEVVRESDIQQVNLQDPSGKRPPPPAQDKLPHAIPILPNVFDRTRPVFDTQGRALQALKSIWLNDPTGPLAADALMLTASHHLRKGDYREADHVFKILREEYPKSPHLENAFVLGSHVKLMSYQGAAYDGQSLEGARDLKESTIRLFPKHPERERFSDELHKIELAAARREWQRIEFYRKKNLPRAVAVHCNLLIEKYPDSSFAQQARELLQELGPEYVDGSWARVPAVPEQTPVYAAPKEPGRVRLSDLE